MSSPVHMEIILGEREQAIAKPTTAEAEKKKVSKKKLKKQKMMMKE